MTAGARTLVRWIGALGTMLVLTAVLHPMRTSIQQVHVVLLYLLVVLAGSAWGGRVLGFTLACLGFLLIDYFFQAPFDRLSVGTSLDWFVLVAFVVTAGVATNLLARAQEAARRAAERADEVARLSRVGSELLSAGRAEDALGAIAEAVRTAVHATACTIFRVQQSAGAPRAEPLVNAGEPPIDPARAGLALCEGAAREDGAVFVPLRVHDRVVGVLGVSGPPTAGMPDAERRFLDALTYYAALAVERVELVKEAEHAEALREADQLRDALLASVSHDLRTPLTTIKVLAQDTLARGDAESALANAASTEEQADRLTRMVNNLLDVTRLRGRAFTVQLDTNAAEDLVGAVARQVAGIMRDRPLERRVDHAGPVLMGRFDFVQSARILTNLIENAVRYSPAGAPVVLSARRDGDALVFEVMDRGPGVPPDEERRIFEAFYRPPNAAPDSGGLGLGLYIARALAEAQGGTLAYEPRAGGGSTFALRLPAEDVELGDDES